MKSSRNSVRSWLWVGCSLLFLINILWFSKLVSRKSSASNYLEVFKFKSQMSTNVEEDYRDVLQTTNPNLPMDDPRLLEAIRGLLIPPTIDPYGYKNGSYLEPGANPSGGQVQAVEDILRGFGGNGFFIECGANDGEWHSNSVFLERTLGWKGLLIEADPLIFANLTARNRNAYMGHFCLSSLTYPKILPFYQDKWLGSLGSGLIKSDQYFAKDAVNVQCLPLYSVLLAMKRTTVDFFSLDIEGSEMDVLKTIPFDKVIFKVITIEHVVLPGGKVELRKFMESKGYVFFQTVINEGFVAGDSIFVHSSVQLTPEQRSRIGKVDGNEMRPVRV